MAAVIEFWLIVGGAVLLWWGVRRWRRSRRQERQGQVAQHGATVGVLAWPVAGGVRCPNCREADLREADLREADTVPGDVGSPA